MTKKIDFDTALKRLETELDAMVEEGMSPESVRDAAVMLGLCEKSGVKAAKTMRAILRLSPPEKSDERKQILEKMIHGFAHMLVGRGYPLSEASLVTIAWGYTGAIETLGVEETALQLRMLAADISKEPLNTGMN